MGTADIAGLVPEAAPALLALLAPGRGILQPPIRSEIFGPQRFAQHGQSLGLTHRSAEVARRLRASFFPRLRDNIASLREAQRYIGTQADSGQDLSPAAEWLLDNFHLIDAQLKEVHEGLPRSYFRALPLLADEPLAGLPRIYGLAWAFVAHTDGGFDEDLLRHYLAAYQQSCELKLGEIWALPTTLRVVLIENLRRLAERVACQKAARELANLCCDQLDTSSPIEFDALLELLNRRGVGSVFLVQLAQRLLDQPRGPDDSDSAIQAWLRRALPDLASQLAQQDADQAADNLSVSNAVTSLRAIGDADWAELVDSSSLLMQRLLSAPCFAAEHPASRDLSLHAIEGLARRSRRTELAVAEALLALMAEGEGPRHPANSRAAYPGFWLCGAGRPRLLRSLGLAEPVQRAARALLHRLALPLYLSSLGMASLGLVAWLLTHAGAAPGLPALLLTGLLMLIPASEAVIALLHRLISESARPSQLPRLALASGIPAEHRVLVAIPCLLSSAATVRALTRRLELHQLANPEAEAQFALLSDWADADSASAAADASLLLDARSQIAALNTSYPAAPGQAPRFALLHRERSYSESEQRWIGWERKRGKLEQLVAMLAEDAAITAGQDAAKAFLDLGAESRIAPGTRYIVTLDSDTQLPPGRLRELVGVAAHPHNEPRLDASGRRMLGGYGILQPQVATPLPDLQDLTPFHWLFAGQCGVDPYSAASSEVYQDLFAEGSFAGKGLLNVRALHAVLAGSLPDARVLSHDLLEGALVRCATLSDISVIEDAPFHADVAAARVHRWTRGDWQLLPFLLNPWRYRIRALNRWKMLDNLRRSLVAPASLALLLLSLASGWLAAPAALALVLAAYMAGPLLGALAALHSHREDLARVHFYRQALADLGRALCGGLWHLQQLQAQALLALDAIVRALYRMVVSHRHLLQWTTAAATQAAAQTQLGTVLRQHRAEPLLAGVLWAALLLWGSTEPGLATALALLWASAPLAVWWASRPRRPRADAALPATDQVYLRGIARDTWRLFERCIGPDDRQLPPDNLQTLPNEMLAHRTSPTNIGLYLLSCACAREFGWIGSVELVQRLQATLATLATLGRHRGHFYNWYDTQSGAALLPIYVSSVDSGNLSGHLLAVAQACQELALAPLDDAAMQACLAELQLRITDAAGSGCAELDWLSSDYEATLRSAALDRQGEAAALSASLSADLRALAQTCERLAWEPEFGFLYHRKRHLFHIGYRVAEQQLDAGFYDLLASESRLTSLLAIAKGDVPVQHWASLGRPFYAVGRHAALRSWSGSMFEYLMPGLILAEPPGSVLREACCAALHEQIDFSLQQHRPGLPWGISESAFAGRDNSLAYQYAPQGVPRLALRRTPADELVIAPYASALAAMLAPHGATRNLRALQALGARERYGFIEALDFSPARLTEAVEGSAELPYAPVATFMSHHQGMSIVALANVLLQGAPQRWGMANAHIAAVASLLHERAPREISTLSTPVLPLPPQLLLRQSPGLQRELLPGGGALAPTQLLSNGRYAVSLRANGAGWSRWGQLGLTRWRDDALRDAYGSFFYLRRSPDASPVSISQHPAPDAAADYRATFHADRVCLHASWPELQAQTTVWVSPEDDIEFRAVELRNLSDEAIELELISAFELTLSEPRADEAHPAFANLFLRAEWQPAQQALWFERKPRLASEPALQAAHFLVGCEAQLLGMAVQTDRLHWLGRNRLVSQPLARLQDVAMATDAPVQALDTGLDPVCVLALRLRIAPHGKALLTFATAASDHAAVLRAVIDKYRQPSHVERASLMSATLTSIRLRALRISPDNHAATQLLSSALIFTLTRPQPALGGSCDKRLLWRYGISGDRPVLLVSIAATQGLGLLRALAQALRLWEWGGLACELVVLNQEPASYQMSLQRELALLRERHLADGLALPQGAVTQFHLLRADEVSAAELASLQALARLRLQADGRPLRQHVVEWAALHEQARQQRQHQTLSPLAQPAAPPEPAISQGEFARDGSAAFGFLAGAGERPQKPWINVLSNADFGCHLSESGGGYTWAGNSRMNQLTAWANDPVADPCGEHLLLQDLRSHELWSASASAGTPARLVYRVRHAQGSTSISHLHGELAVSLSCCVDAHSAVKQLRLQIRNLGPRTRHLRVLALAEWMLGASRADRASLHTEGPGPQGALFATQRERSANLGGGTAFLALAGAVTAMDWSCDRREFFDASGTLVLPAALGRMSGSGLDPCAALATELVIASGASEQCVFLLGYAATPAAARSLAASAVRVPAQTREDEALAQWDELLGATTVATPDPLFDAMVNRWLLYQTLGCRIWAKAGLYQAGGATGFRDHLQDAMALAWAAPARLRAQILLAASRQFPEGDVQHWWHAPGGAGVRTHCSDDLLWLPHSLLHYLRASDDQALLDEPLPFLTGPAIAPGAEDVYDTPGVSSQLASVYEHAALCIDHSLRVGTHGLPLMGSGDWNDGMNRVGDQGRGESVWLAWFLCQLVAGFAPLARQRGDAARAQRWELAAQGWQAALQGPAWDGLWFKRAFFDDGSPLGSHANAEARIDLIAQAWSVLSGVAELPQQRLAMAALERELVDHEAGLLRLLQPPLVQAEPSAGYIQAYPPGVRENGGQYSHAGVWALMAQAQLAQDRPQSDAADLAYRYFTYLSPAHRAADAQRGPAYAIEPYVMAGDTYSQPPYVGRGGWSWYTGSAAWLQRAAIESLLGLRLEAHSLHFQPCLPSHWPQAQLTLRRGPRVMRFLLLRAPPALACKQAAAILGDGTAAVLLLPGQALDWPALALDSSFVIPLLP